MVDVTQKSVLLVIDDDPKACHLIERMFREEGFEVLSAPNGEAGLRRVAADRPRVVLLDLNLPDLDGLTVLERLKASSPSLPVIMLTASTDLRIAVRALRLGAYDYLAKPFSPPDVIVAVRRALEAVILRAEVGVLRRQVDNSHSEALATQMGPSAHIRRVIDQVETVAATSFTVLVMGETGTGKELVAQAIRQSSVRRHKPFIALDCGAIPEPLLESELFGHEKGAFTGADRRREGRLALAEGGTCFLDEVGNMAMALQAKLLRTLESRELQPVGSASTRRYDVRFIAATNDDLQARIARGLFRADLYFRLAQYTIAIPPLRERADDIAHLAQRFLEEAGLELRRPVQTIVPEALDLLRSQKWPGNVRQLRNVIRQSVLRGTDLIIRADTIRAALGESMDSPHRVTELGVDDSLSNIAHRAARDAERQAIASTLRVTHGNKSQAARLLKTDYKTLHVKMKHLGLRSRDFVL